MKLKYYLIAYKNKVFVPQCSAVLIQNEIMTRTITLSSRDVKQTFLKCAWHAFVSVKGGWGVGTTSPNKLASCEQGSICSHQEFMRP